MNIIENANHISTFESIKQKKPRKPRTVREIEFRDPVLAKAILAATPMLVDQSKTIAKMRLDIDNLERFLRKSKFRNDADVQIDADHWIVWAIPNSVKPSSPRKRHLFLQNSIKERLLLQDAPDAIVAQVFPHLPRFIQAIAGAAARAN